MKDLLSVLGMIVVAIVVGGVLYFFGPTLSRTLLNHPGENLSFTVIDSGGVAVDMDHRANVRLQNADDLQRLWSQVYGADAPAPDIDFNKYDVFAVFEGSHSTSGYGIKISAVYESNGMRSVQVLRTVPGPSCTTASQITSPFQMIRISKTDLEYSVTDTTETTTCP